MPPDPAEQPTLSDGTVTLRAWREEDVARAVAGHDDRIGYWFGRRPRPDVRRSSARCSRSAAASTPTGTRFSFVVDVDGTAVGGASTVTPRRAGHRRPAHRGPVLVAVLRAARPRLGHPRGPPAGRLGAHRDRPGRPRPGRVEARVEPGNEASLRVATRSGLRREGVRRVEPGTGDRAETTTYVVLARLGDDPPLNEPEAFRALLNSFLPRKRAISQMLLRDRGRPGAAVPADLQADWDLPGGVVEVGESPQLAAGREVEEELGLDHRARAAAAHRLAARRGAAGTTRCAWSSTAASTTRRLLDGVVMQAARDPRRAEFCTLEQVRERCADFTARRIEAALRGRGGDRSAYTESGR